MIVSMFAINCTKLWVGQKCYFEICDMFVCLKVHIVTILYLITFSFIIVSTCSIILYTYLIKWDNEKQNCIIKGGN